MDRIMFIATKLNSTKYQQYLSYHKFPPVSTIFMVSQNK